MTGGYIVNENGKDRSFITKFIMYMMFFIVFFIVLCIDKSISSVDISSQSVITISYIFSTVLYLATIQSSIYYYNSKKNTDVIFYVVYYMVAFALNIMNQTTWIKLQQEYLLACMFFTNKVLLLMTVVPNKEFKNKFAKKRNILAIIIILTCLIITSISINIFDIRFISSLTMEYLYLHGIIVYIFVSITNLKKFKATKDNLYILLTALLLNSCIKDYYLYMLYHNDFLFNKYLILVILVMCINLIMYSIGVLIISDVDKNNKLKNMQDLDAFYNILDKETNDKEIYFLTKEWKMIYANKKAREKHGVDENDIKAFKTMGEFFKISFENPGKEFQKIILESLEKNRGWRGVVGNNENNEILVDITIQTSKDYGEIYLLQIDLNKEMIKLKKEIERKNKLFDIITQKSGDLIGIIDKEQRFNYFNDEFYRLLGYDEDDMIGKKISEFFINNNEIGKSEKTFFNELKLKCKNNDILYVEALATPIDDEGWVIVCRNITYRREVKFLKEEYEKIKIHQQLKNDFFANLSHELKTPLNIFYATIQLLDSSINKNKEDFKLLYKKYNNGLKINFYRMLKTITNLIDLTKLDSNFQSVKFSNYDIVKLCEDVSLSVITYAQQKNINITFDTQEEEHIIKCDGEYMERILLNLLSNAIKYTPYNGEIFVNLNFKKDYICISVKDNGVGIPKEKLESVFEKFVRVDKSLSREQEGSGIGLSIVKSLVDLLQGNICIKSEENVGTEFIIEIPDVKLEEDIKSHNVDEEKVTLELSDIYAVL